MKLAVVALSVIVLILGLAVLSKSSKSEWAGVDESIVEKFAKRANREASRPLLDVMHGDMGLFVFLLAGTAGGFLGGYFFRELFPPKDKNRREGKSNVSSLL